MYTKYNYMTPEDQGADAMQAAPAASQAAGLSSPAGAAMNVGGQFLMQYMAQKARENEAKKQAALGASQQYTQDQMSILNNLMNSYKTALR